MCAKVHKSSMAYAHVHVQEHSPLNNTRVSNTWCDRYFMTNLSLIPYHCRLAHPLPTHPRWSTQAWAGVGPCICMMRKWWVSPPIFWPLAVQMIAPHLLLSHFSAWCTYVPGQQKHIRAVPVWRLTRRVGPRWSEPLQHGQRPGHAQLQRMSCHCFVVLGSRSGHAYAMATPSSK